MSYITKSGTTPARPEPAPVAPPLMRMSSAGYPPRRTGRPRGGGHNGGWNGERYGGGDPGAPIGGA
ncbi:hypothetical protein ACFV97_07030 [Streptomyces sp. NPDC059913]|uniref:hypothetical protein n=1 Tax=unclassified Streptomyces TaxID=2593676 RepID=UPI00365C1A33